MAKRPVLLVTQAKYKRLLVQGVKDIALFQNGGGYGSGRDVPEVVGDIIFQAFTQDDPKDGKGVNVTDYGFASPEEQRQWAIDDERAMRADVLDGSDLHMIVAKDIALVAATTGTLTKKQGYLK